MYYNQHDDSLRYANGAEVPDDQVVWAELDRLGLVRAGTARSPGRHALVNPCRHARVADLLRVRSDLHAAALAAPAETQAQRAARYRAALAAGDDPAGQARLDHRGAPRPAPHRAATTTSPPSPTMSASGPGSAGDSCCRSTRTRSP